MIIGHDKFMLSDTIDRELYKMSSIWRYNSRLVHKQENLAEHSFYVAFKVYELGYKFGIDEDRINKAVKIALCHDCGELYTGDLPHSLKVFSPEIKKIAEKLEVDLISQHFKYFADDFKAFSQREDELVCTLVETADCLDVIMYIDRERQLGNNDSDVIDIQTECTERYIRLATKLEQLCNEVYNR